MIHTGITTTQFTQALFTNSICEKVEMTEAPTTQHLNSTVGDETKGATHPTVTEAPPDRSEHLTLPATCTGLAVAVLAHVISLSPSSQNLFALIFTRDVHHLVVDIVSKSKANYVTFLSLVDGSHLSRDSKHSHKQDRAREQTRTGQTTRLSDDRTLRMITLKHHNARIVGAAAKDICASQHTERKNLIFVT